MKNKFTAYLRLIRADKPIGTFLLLWPTLAAVWLAGAGHPPLKVVIIFIVGTFVMRSAGCVINDCADRDFDKQVARTQMRPLTTGEISFGQAFGCCVLLLTMALLLVLQLNRFTLYMAVIGLLITTVYPFLKRLTHLPQVGLGLAFNWGILMAFTAIQNKITVVALLFFMAALLITVCYDTFYGLVDKEYDEQIGLKSTAILFGDYTTVLISSLQLIALGLLISVGVLLKLNYCYYVGLLMWLLLIIGQHGMVKEHQPEQFFKAFLNNNWSWLVVFLGVLMAYGIG